ncbi:MAG: hypothetical protein ACREGJ_00440 [Candidatus Saccharimonadales bacterium]
MIEFIKARGRRTRFSEIFYVIFNALLPVVLLLLVRGFDPPLLAFALVFLSKWRVFALRPRFWWPNIKANAVDLLVGVSAVGLMYLASTMLVLQILIAIAYAAWLLIVKPRSSSKGIKLQAGIAQFVGLLTLFHFSIVIPELMVVAGCWLIGYVVARHAISNYEESHVELFSAIWGLVVAELGWLLYRWTIVYDLGLPIKIPQMVLLVFVIGFSAIRMYHLAKHEQLTAQALRGTVIFASLLLAAILVFSPWDATV